ncbi:MAG: transglutaminase domain-containing protein [Clostridium sp.]
MHNFQLLCGGIVIFFIIYSLFKVYNSEDIDHVIEPISSGISTIFAILIFLWNFQVIDVFITKILTNFFKNTIKDNGIIHIILLLISFILLKVILFYFFKGINSLIIHSQFKDLDKKNPFFIALVSCFGVIRGLIFIALIVLSIVIYNGSVEKSKQVQFLKNFNIYKNLEILVDNNQITVVTNGVKENISSNKIIYYNGITVDEGVKSNEYIKNTSEKLTKNLKFHREKAYALYEWIGKNITYDDEKAKNVMELNGNYESGAIITFNKKRGICFDFSCLFTAMAKDIGLKSRIIVGKAFNGNEYISHAWNQVYLEDEKRWINIDSTFYNAGEYFDSYNFNEDHILEEIAGEY